jgi:hypothetical protein
MLIFILICVFLNLQAISPSCALGRHDVDDTEFVKQAQSFGAVGQLYFSSAQKEVSTGTGTLVEHKGVKFVLTTGHMSSQAKVKEIEFEGKRHSIDRYIPLQHVILKDILPEDQIQNIARWSGMDVGIAFLQTYPNHIQPLSLSQQFNSFKDQEYAFVGYGLKSVNFWRGLMINQDEKRRLYTTKITFKPLGKLLSAPLASRISNPYIGVFSAVFKQPDDQEVTSYEGCVSPGYSGGPLIVKSQDGKGEIIGVVASSQKKSMISCCLSRYMGIDYSHYGQESYYSPLISTLPFIEMFLLFEKYEQYSKEYFQTLRPDEEYLQFKKEDHNLRTAFQETFQRMVNKVFFSYDELKDVGEKFQDLVEKTIQKLEQAKISRH